MGDHSASVSSLICTLLLSDANVLSQAWRKPFDECHEWHDWRHSVYVAYHPWAARYPDHVFNSAWRALIENSEKRPFLLDTLSFLVDEYLEVKNGAVYVKREAFGSWKQSIVSRISGLTVLAAAEARFADRVSSNAYGGSAAKMINDLAPWADECLPVLRPHDSEVESYITKHGLNETHLHLNGTTYSEVCWLRALAAPNEETEKFAQTYHKGLNRERLQELIALVNPHLCPKTLNQGLIVARVIRSYLIAVCRDVLDENEVLPLSCNAIVDAPSKYYSGEGVADDWRSAFDITVAEEMSWQKELIKMLTHSPNERLARIFHCYLLLQNQYYRLMVQGEMHFGFDQFQKFTWMGLRERAERTYTHRFKVMHGRHNSTSRVNYLEGRFAPPNKFEVLVNLLQSILDGYRQYLGFQMTGQEPPEIPGGQLNRVISELESVYQSQLTRGRSVLRLGLVAHFIKTPWRIDKSLYRHSELDKRLRECTTVLLKALSDFDGLSNWIRGIDAAASELDAPPECFTSVFRVCRKAGLGKRTFHAGEDFPHLLSGIRYMADALELLDLQQGDRLGHGTAMGIQPRLWIERMPRRVSIGRGEWLLSVLAAWRFLKDDVRWKKEAGLLLNELEKTASEIFGISISGVQVSNAMKLRDLSAYEVYRFRRNDQKFQTYSDIWLEEVTRVHDAYKADEKCFDILSNWLCDKDVWRKSEELVQKDTLFLDEGAYIAVQQSLMEEVARRGVLIETLPSSNVRISQYFSFDEHHALRWMKAGHRAIDDDPTIGVTLGSDDPGIFATDLESEFYHLFAAMTNIGVSEGDALKLVSQLNERGKTNSFLRSESLVTQEIIPDIKEHVPI